jgi:hypothetical protein
MASFVKLIALGTKRDASEQHTCVSQSASLSTHWGQTFNLRYVRASRGVIFHMFSFRSPEFGFIKLEMHDRSSAESKQTALIGYEVMPVSSLRCGYRYITLRVRDQFVYDVVKATALQNQFGTPLPGSRVIVYIAKNESSNPMEERSRTLTIKVLRLYFVGQL